MPHAAGVYSATETGLAFEVGFGGSGPVFRTRTTVHILFPDGRYRFDWPGDGLAGDLAADARANPYNWGDWRLDEATVTVRRAGDEHVFELAPGALIGPGGARYTRLESASDRLG